MFDITRIDSSFELRHTTNCLCQVCRPQSPAPKLKKLQIFCDNEWKTAVFIEYKDYFWHVVYTNAEGKYYWRMESWRWNLY